MGEVDLGRAKEIFGEALELQGAARAEYLAKACGSDGALRSRVEALLASAEGDHPFLRGATLNEIPEGAPTTGDDESSGNAGARGEKPGSRIGPYRLLQQIGEGGFGIVFMAEQERPVRRRVALKVIKLGMDTRAVVARFEQERQALAVLDHPNIAKVLDAGATDSGRPYFVMELVKGEPITNYCDSRSLTITERLDLFTQVCQAVQHAHTKGIIHRDLKPSNVLVSEIDGRATARVIDFGIAKATERRLTEKTLFTEFQQIIGTPEYMSPEQAGGSLDIDTRTDVYSLGVLLYELVTGTTPFDGKVLRSAAYGELQRIIREQDPPRPSTRLSESAATIDGIAARRRVEPRRLGALVRGELDWIVMKAMEKDRGRRYETPSSLASDVHRYLEGGVVTAAPPSAVYRVRKFVRRNRGAVIAGSAIFFAVLAGAVGAGVGLVQAETARANEKTQGEIARRQAQIAGAANAFLNDMLKRADRGAEGGRADVTVREVLDAASEDLWEAKKGEYDPEVLASVHETVGRTYIGLGLYEKAERHLRESLRLRREVLGGSSKDVAHALQMLSGVLFHLQQNSEAEHLAREALDLDRGAGTMTPMREAEHRAALGLALGGKREFAAAQKEYETALTLLRSMPEPNQDKISDVLTNIGLMLQNQHKDEEAERTYREALAMRRAIDGGESTEICTILNNLAWLLSEREDFAGSEAMYDEAIAMRRRLLGPDHPLLAMTINNFGGMLQRKGDLTRAEAALREALAMRERRLGPEDATTIGSMENIGNLLHSQGKLDEAEAMYTRSLALRRKVLGNDDPDVADSLGNMATLKMDQNKPDEAVSLMREGIAIRRRANPGSHPHTATALITLSVMLARSGKMDESVTSLREAVRMHRDLLPDGHPELVRTLMNMGVLLQLKGDNAEAAAVLREALEKDALNTKGPKNPMTTTARTSLGISLAALSWEAPTDPASLARAQEAVTFLRRAVEERTVPGREPDLSLVVTQSALGGALVTVEHCRTAPDTTTAASMAEAETFITGKFEMIAASVRPGARDRTRVRAAAERAVRLYEVWERLDPGNGHAQKADTWKARLAEL